jgi:hypothetical protein
MDLLKFSPTDGPPQILSDIDWPSEKQREERLSHLGWGHIKVFGNGSKQVIDAVPLLFAADCLFATAKPGGIQCGFTIP